MGKGLIRGFPSTSAGKELPTIQKTAVWLLGREDSLEKG